MSKKMKLPFTLKHTENAAAAAPWLWPTCANNPRTLSFSSNSDESTYTITNSTSYLEDHDRNNIEFIDTPDSFFSATASFNSEISNIGQQNIPNDNDASAATAVVQGLKSNRLFFKPGETSSILEEAKTHDVFPRMKSVKILAMDSRDPFTDFRVSMKEMVEAHGLKDDWYCLEELLAYYLRVNCRSNHGYIVGAFVDLLLHLQNLAVSAKVSSNPAIIDERCSSSSTATHSSFTSHMSIPSSTCPSASPCLSSRKLRLD